jgi:hypothetical protein
MADQEKRGRGRPKGSITRQKHNEKTARKIGAEHRAQQRAKTPEKRAEDMVNRGLDISDLPDLPLDQLCWATRKFAERGDLRGLVMTANMAAPYIHPKKQAVEITGDMQNPLAVATVSLDKHEYQEIARRLLDEV